MTQDEIRANQKMESMQRWIDHHNERADKLEEENKRLREALEDIARGQLQGPFPFEEYAKRRADKALNTPTTEAQ